jgi:hypothetical protein
MVGTLGISSSVSFLPPASRLLFAGFLADLSSGGEKEKGCDSIDYYTTTHWQMVIFAK